MAKCPHCSEPLSGFVDQATLEQRLNAKQQQIDAANTEVTRLKQEATAAAGAQAELEQLRNQAQVDAKTIRRLGAVSDRSLVEQMDFIELAYEKAHVGKPADQRPDLADWLRSPEGGQAHPLIGQIAQRIAGTTAPPPPTTPPATPPAAPPATPPATPPTTRPPGQQPPTNQGRMTPAQVQAYFDSPEYRGLSKEERAKRRSELQQQTDGQHVTA